MKKILLAVMLMCVLSGCGKDIYAGSAGGVETTYTEARLGEYTDVSWNSGGMTNTGNIRVTMKSGKDASSILKQYDTSFIPFDEYDACSWIAVNVEPVTYDVPLVFIASPDSGELIFNSIKYNGAAYRLKDGWYAAAVPNGMYEYSILVGTSRFPVKVEKPKMPETVEETVQETIEQMEIISETESSEESVQESSEETVQETEPKEITEDMLKQLFG